MSTARNEHYALLFAQLLRLLGRPSSFNLSLPEPFRNVAHRYLADDPATVMHFGDPAIRHFMLSEVHDYVMLTGGLALKRRQISS